MIDTHCHLDDEQFEADREAVIARAAAAGVEQMISLGTTAASSRATVRLAETYPSLYAAVGIHPNSCAEAASGDWDTIHQPVGSSPRGRPGRDRASTATGTTPRSNCSGITSTAICGCRNSATGPSSSIAATPRPT